MSFKYILASVLTLACVTSTHASQKMDQATTEHLDASGQQKIDSAKAEHPSKKHHKRHHSKKKHNKDHHHPHHKGRHHSQHDKKDHHKWKKSPHGKKPINAEQEHQPVSAKAAAAKSVLPGETTVQAKD